MFRVSQCLRGLHTTWHGYTENLAAAAVAGRTFILLPKSTWSCVTKDRPWRFKRKSCRETDTMCVCIKAPLISRGTCEILVVFVSGGPPHRVRPCSSPRLPVEEKSASFLRASVSPSSGLRGTTTKKNPRWLSNTRIHSWKSHFLSPWKKKKERF